MKKQDYYSQQRERLLEKRDNCDDNQVIFFPIGGFGFTYPQALFNHSYAVVDNREEF